MKGFVFACLALAAWGLTSAVLADAAMPDIYIAHDTGNPVGCEWPLEGVAKPIESKSCQWALATRHNEVVVDGQRWNHGHR